VSAHYPEKFDKNELLRLEIVIVVELPELGESAFEALVHGLTEAFSK